MSRYVPADAKRKRAIFFLPRVPTETAYRDCLPRLPNETTYRDCLPNPTAGCFLQRPPVANPNPPKPCPYALSRRRKAPRLVIVLVPPALARAAVDGHRHAKLRRHASSASRICRSDRCEHEYLIIASRSAMACVVAGLALSERCSQYLTARSRAAILAS